MQQRIGKQSLLKLVTLCAVLMLGLLWILRGPLQPTVVRFMDTEIGSITHNNNYNTTSKPTQPHQKKNHSDQISQKQSTKPGNVCDATFGKTLEENIDKVKSYNLSEADPYFHDLDPLDTTPKVILKGPEISDIEVPTVVTGASSNHFLESLEMLKGLNKVVRSAYKTIEVFYYDLGLESEEKDQVKVLCNCTIVKFPFDKFPAHVRRLKGYCWKPLIIKMVLKTRRFVMWMDASIQFKKSDLDRLFIQAKQQGVMMWHNVWSLPAHIHQDTFNFLQETPCLYKGFTEYHAGLILFHSGHETVKNYILDPWVKCALIEDCLKTKHDEKTILKCPNHKEFHACHRFDQAVLSLLIFRLFHDSYKDHNIASSYFRICYGSKCAQ